MITTIVFDMGGVLMDFAPDKFVKHYTELSKEDQDLLEKEIFLDYGWSMLDFGLHSEDEYIQIVKERVPQRLHDYVEKLIRHWDDLALPVPGTKDVVAALKKKGYKLYLLSNAGPRHDEYFPKLSGSEYFDGKVVSSYEKQWKPNPGLYKLLFERFNLNPKECIFIDDRVDNVVAGEMLGMQGIVFTDANTLKKELENRDIL